MSRQNRRTVLRDRQAPDPGPRVLTNRPPSHESAALPGVVEIPAPESMKRHHERECWEQGRSNTSIRFFVMGPVRVILTKESGRLHMSVSCTNRLPTWNELARLRYELLPRDRDAVMVLPPKAQYINIHEFCFQVFEVDPAVVID